MTVRCSELGAIRSTPARPAHPHPHSAFYTEAGLRDMRVKAAKRAPSFARDLREMW